MTETSEGSSTGTYRHRGQIHYHIEAKDTVATAIAVTAEVVAIDEEADTDEQMDCAVPEHWADADLEAG